MSADAWLHHYRRVPSGGRYTQADLSEPPSHPDAREGYEWVRAEPLHLTQPALTSCLDVLLRMIPEFTEETGVEMCNEEEHNSAIEAAAIALHGDDRSAWPPGVKKAAEGEYE